MARTGFEALSSAKALFSEVMKLPEMEKLAETLEEEAQLVVWEDAGRLEVVAVRGVGFEDAFPLPIHVQAAAAEAEMILDTSTAVRLEIEKLPADCWAELEEFRYGEHLVVWVLGRSGRKYLSLYRAVREGEGTDFGKLKDLELSEGELLKVSRWMREESLFDHQSGDVMMKIFTQLR